MVRFENDKFIIEVYAGANSAVEQWRLTFGQLIDVLQRDVQEERMDKFFYLELMREMLPDDETIAQMQNIQKTVK